MATNNKALAVRLTPAMRKALEELAERNGRTASHEVRMAIRNHLAEQSWVTGGKAA